MKTVYVFKVALKHRKGLWRRIEIESNQTLGDLDETIREAFGHDLWDHLSEFFPGRVWRSEGYGSIVPGGGGEGAEKRVSQLALAEGGKMEYVYDFGDDIQHIITLEKIVEAEEGIRYPRITAKNRPRYHYCEVCKKSGKKTVATWICLDCSEGPGTEVFLCEDCLTKEHEDHYAEELIY